ncbi:unnamed protein product [Mesocestoides corti]|uniref:Centrosomal protein of 19 kDa n=1 Tax=Mesocestoides corti TaxID=53468 RepID=A0A0R3UE97_MESCO|nr:unnamed protein product [Mesocestoides corti]
MFGSSSKIISSRRAVSCGIRGFPPQLLIKYLEDGKKKLRVIHLRNIDKIESAWDCVNELYKKPEHFELLSQLPRPQAMRLIFILKDLRRGISLQQSLRANEALDRISPNEDLNKVADEIVERKKLMMNELFESNRIRPGDPDFQYDISIDFPEQANSNDWDSDLSDFWPRHCYI